MSEAIHFDTHKFVKRMTETGMSEATAEALADEQLRLIQGELATKTDLAALQAATKADIEALRLATKADIEGLRLSTQADIAELRAATQADIAALHGDIDSLRLMTQADIAELREATRADIAGVRLEIEKTKADLIRWMAGLLIAQGGVIIAMLRVFPA